MYRRRLVNQQYSASFFFLVHPPGNTPACLFHALPLTCFFSPPCSSPPPHRKLCGSFAITCHVCARATLRHTSTHASSFTPAPLLLKPTKKRPLHARCRPFRAERCQFRDADDWFCRLMRNGPAVRVLIGKSCLGLGESSDSRGAIGWFYRAGYLMYEE